MTAGLKIRIADRSDRTDLRAMQAASFRALGAGYYDAPTIEAFIAEVGTMDDHLLDDGAYKVAMFGDCIVACGGWSRRTPSYDLHPSRQRAEPQPEKATVRSVYVHPDWARRGLARLVMTAVEADIAAAGFDRVSLTATLSGVDFYRRLGYLDGAPVTLRLAGGLPFGALAMSKPLDRARDAADLAA